MRKYFLILIMIICLGLCFTACKKKDNNQGNNPQQQQGQNDPNGNEGDPSGNEGDPNGNEGDPSGNEGDPSGNEGDPSGNEGDPNGNEGDPSGNNDEDVVIFTFESANEISFSKKDDDKVYYLTSEEKINAFIENINKVKGKEVELEEGDFEASFVIVLDDVKIEVGEDYLCFNNKYYSFTSGLEFINSYNSENVDRTSTSTGWLPFI